MPNPSAFAFGAYCLDVANARLLKQDNDVPLPPKAFAMLVYLLEHRGKLVTKDQLLDAVWEGRYVSEGVLKSTMQVLRLALDDDAKAPRYLETVHKRGYRFIAEVSTSRPTTAQPDTTLPNLAPLVGRDAELAQLRQCLALALSGQPQLVLVAGQAGIGKTLLIEHFLADSAGQIAVGRGQCVEQYGPSEPYLPILEALNQLCRQQAPNALATLADTAPDWLAEMPWLTQPPTATTGRHAHSPARRLRELGELLAQWSHAFPLIIVLEDVHWSDRATLDALAFLARRKQSARWLILVSYRPEQPGSNSVLPPLVADLRLRGLAIEINLPLLSETAVAEYLRRRGGMSDTHLSTAIYRRSEGLPFFMARLADNLDNVDDALATLPEDLQQLLNQHYERLPETQQRLLEAAAVIGMTFNVSLLAHLTDHTATATEQLCETLRRGRQFLSRTQNQDETGSYAFLHAYYHDYLYQRLPALTKAELHRRTAYWLQANTQPGIDDPVSALALHFEKGDEYDKALDYLQRATTMARQRQAHNEIITLSQRALSLLATAIYEPEQHKQRQIEWYVQLGMAMRSVQGYGVDGQAEVYRQAFALGTQLADTTALLPLSKARAYFHLVRLELAQAQTLAQQLLEQATALDLPHYQLSANLILAGVCFVKASPAFANYSGQAMRLYQPELDAVLLSYSAQHPLASLGYLRGWYAWLQGRPEQALTLQQASLSAVEKLDHPISEAFACLSCAVIFQLRGEWQAQEDICRRANTLAETYGLTSVQRWQRFFQAWQKIRLGQIEPGLAAMRGVVEDYLASGSKGVFTFQMLAWYADLSLSHRQLEQARCALQQARDLLPGQSSFLDAEFDRIQGEWLLAMPQADQDQAEALFIGALASAERQGATSLALRAATSLARLRLAQNRQEDGLLLLQDLYARFSEGFDTHDLRVAAALLGERGYCSG